VYGSNDDVQWTQLIDVKSAKYLSDSVLGKTLITVYTSSLSQSYKTYAFAIHKIFPGNDGECNFDELLYYGYAPGSNELANNASGIDPSQQLPSGELVYTFVSPFTAMVLTKPAHANILVVGGGASGGHYAGGGGGQVVQSMLTLLQPGTYILTVGSGGAYQFATSIAPGHVSQIMLQELQSVISAAGGQMAERSKGGASASGHAGGAGCFFSQNAPYVAGGGGGGNSSVGLSSSNCSSFATAQGGAGGLGSTSHISGTVTTYGCGGSGGVGMEPPMGPFKLMNTTCPFSYGNGGDARSEGAQGVIIIQFVPLSFCVDDV
jgi:hypothetical protein